ncbi:MAG: transglutaminase domain-containing protein, partial [Acidimicrobiales bacterium]
MMVLRALRRPERAWPAEDSVALRVATAGAVCVAIGACAAQGEVPLWFATTSAALVVVGGAFSYRKRKRPLLHLKFLLGAAVLGAFAWFFVALSTDAASGRLGALEPPLAVLFASMQAAHAFDMPSRRDLGLSLAGSASLIAVAGAQAIDLSFGLYVGLWAAIALLGLHAMWSSMVGGAVPRPASVVASSVAAILFAALLVTFLPAPLPPGASASPGAGVTPEAGTIAQPARIVAARPTGQNRTSASGPTRVGGYLGFAAQLDTALRPGLGTQVVLRVRAERPTYWVAETFDAWSGESWTRSGTARATRRASPRAGSGRAGRGDAVEGRAGWTLLDGGPPFVVAPDMVAAHPSRPAGSADPGRSAGTAVTAPASGATPAAPRPDYQTFYLAAAASGLLLHADQATAVWIPTRRLYVAADTIAIHESLGAGSEYSVESTVATPSDAVLENANGTAGLTPAVVRKDLELPRAYPRVAALARRVTEHDATTVSKIVSLERWIGTHTSYTLDIPPLAPGQDSVVQFLFGSRRGFCEQISTSLAVMLRTLGVPAREAVGYVPGSFDPITGLYEEEAKDAHAWVQVWFPGFGWQNFDPTAYVPATNPSPASAIGHDLVAAIRRVPVVPTVVIVSLLVLAELARRLRRRRNRPWRAKVTRELERAARRAQLCAEPGTTLGALAAALDAALDGELDGAPSE